MQLTDKPTSINPRQKYYLLGGSNSNFGGTEFVILATIIAMHWMAGRDNGEN